MNKLVRTAYETMGTSSYLSVTCPAEVELIHYQLETLLSNQIKNILAVSKQLIDGETVIYYNITSQIPLSQVLEKRKLKRKELLNLIEGITAAVQDASAYRLPEEGIMVEPDYLYVNPASCKPSFLYLPLEQPGEWTIKDLVASLIMHDQIELSNDNLIQVLLKELNREPFSLESLEKSLKQYQGNPAGQTEKVPQMVRPEAPAYVNQSVHGALGAEVNHNPGYGGSATSSLNHSATSSWGRSGEKTAEQIPQPARQEEGIKAGKIKPEKPKPGKQKPKKEKPDKIKQQKNPAEGEMNSAENDEFDAEKAKKMFMLPQAVIMVIVAAGVSFGWFVDEAGKIVVNNILVLVILVILTEVIFYREIFINRKTGGKQKEKKPVKPKKADLPAGTKKPAPPKPSRPAVSETVQPVQQNSYIRQPGYTQQSNASLQKNYAQQTNDFQQTNYLQQQNYMQQVSPYPQSYGQKPIQGEFVGEDDTDISNETELWDGTPEDGVDAYLEYYEDNRLIKIPLSSSGSTIIGRLESQVDFAVRNPKVGKVHAKFYGQGSQYYVVDINSKNGTYINGSRTRIESNSPCLLHDQDRITLADTEFIIRCARN